MKMAKKTLALALAVMMVMAVLVIPASATGADYEGYFKNFRTTSRYNYIAGYASAAQSFLLGYSYTENTIRNSGGVDGMFGAATAEAVSTFQGKQSLAKDGIIGPNTWGKMACYMNQAGNTLRADGRNVIYIGTGQSLYKFYYYNTDGQTYSSEPFHTAGV